MGRPHDIPRRREIRLADFQVDDLAALRFQAPCLHQDIEGGFPADPAHPLSELF
jgi:hypothetical protein